MKRCCTCKKKLPFSSFYKNRSKKDGYALACSDCYKAGNFGKVLQCTQCGADFKIKHRNIRTRKLFLCAHCLMEATNRKLITRNKERATYKTIHQKGYEYTFCHTRQKYVFTHRLAIERSLGRFLSKKEVVHHIDNDVTNNELTNLWLTDPMNHKKAHVSLLRAAWNAVKRGDIKFDSLSGEYK